MAKDAELDRLKAAQDLAFSRKQTAFQTQDAAWKRRKAAGDKMHGAFEEKDRAYHAQQSAWDDLQRLRDSKGPRIGQLNDLQERAFQNMKSSYDSASSAFDRRDGAGAKSYAEQGRSYKAESQGYVEERRRLVAELRSAGDNQKSYAPAFQAAKGRFDSAKREFDAAKAAHERTQTEFKAAKEAFDKASSAFKAQLDSVKAQNAKKKNDKRSIAEKAGVPYQYLDKVYVSKDANGNTNIYFGGMGEPNGPGHGHYVVDRSGKVTYKREPYEEHGGKNFTESQRDYTDLIGKEIAGGEFGFLCRFRGFDAHVESNVNKQGRAKIDIYYGPNGPFGPGHHHTIAYRETPYEFFYDEYR
jgi:hypothetical protein